MESSVLAPQLWSWLGQYYVVPLGIAGLLVLMSLKMKFSNVNLPPGPPGLPVIGHLHLLGKLPHQALQNLARKYGPIMLIRMGFSKVVVISSTDLAKEVLKTQDRNFASRPLTIIGEVFSENNEDVVFSPLNDEWRLMRKICVTQLLTPKRITENQDLRREECVGLVGRLLDMGNEGKLVSVDEQIADTAFNNIARIVLKKNIYEVNPEKQVQNLSDLTRKVVSSPLFPGEYIRFLRFFDLGGAEARLKSLTAQYDKVLSDLVEESRQKAAKLGHQSSKNQNFVDILVALQGMEDGHRITDKRIKGVLKNMLIAGSDTNAHQITWTVVELMRHPEIRQRVQEELDSVVGRERLVVEADLANLKYLQAVVKESFRLHAVVPLMIPHQSVADTTVAGYHVPGNTRVLVNVYAIMRDPNIWENPLVFNPDRFLKKSIDYGGQDFEFLPFGSGRRMCVGYNLGVILVELNTAQLLQACEFDFPSGMGPEDVDVEELFGVTVPRSRHLELLISPRLPRSAYSAAGLDLKAFTAKR